MSEHVQFEEELPSKAAPLDQKNATGMTASLAKSLGISREIASVALLLLAVAITAVSIYIARSAKEAPRLTQPQIEQLEESLRVKH